MRRTFVYKQECFEATDASAGILKRQASLSNFALFLVRFLAKECGNVKREKKSCEG